MSHQGLGSEMCEGEHGDESKKDHGKARYDLIPPEPLEALAQLYGIGAVKYTDRGWESGMKWGRVFAAMMRHGWKWWSGETYDPVDGQHHLTSVAWCAFALMAYETRGVGEDDRAIDFEPELPPVTLTKEQMAMVERCVGRNLNGFDPQHVARVADRFPAACPDLDQEYPPTFQNPHNDPGDESVDKWGKHQHY